MKKALAWIALLAVIGLVIVAVQHSKKSTETNLAPSASFSATSTEAHLAPIKIGMVYALTGLGSFWATLGKNAATMAAEEINAAGGVHGRPIQLIFEDSQSDASKAVSAYQKLTQVDGVDAVVGDVWAYLTNPLIPLAEKSKTLTISPTVMDKSVEGQSDYFFTLGHQVDSVRGAIETFFDKHASAKTVGLICLTNNPWGIAYTKVYKDVIKERNLTLVSEACTSDFGADYKIEATKMKSAHPDVIVLDGFGDRAVRAMKNLDIQVPILSDSNLILGFETGNTVTLSQLNDVFVIDWRANDDFVKKYENEFAQVPVLEAQNSYEAIRSIAMAFVAFPRLPLMGLKAVNYESVDGQIDFGDGSTNINPNKAQAKLYKILGKGEYEEVK